MTKKSIKYLLKIERNENIEENIIYRDWIL